MIKLIILLMSTLSSIFLLEQEPNTAHVLKITVNNIKNIKGKLQVCLTDKKEDFLKQCDYAKTVAVRNNTISLKIANIKTGVYSVSLFHDENNNGVLDTKGLFGIPSEPYGFSNNPRTTFGPPSFENCTFLIDGDKQIYIKL
ncbi:DUF2141 domain-containing protein [Flavobacteriaceae bacterium]|jgi:uncharacterized protein (DUF2141 family)|nr:DUF2141 domain-containing protein [Flavobacteriaceae bacterium]|tara:strand:- start:1583 stop:2008 length:426 start_codon:yes stop_codon:yes gene_type:complete